jgi:hypothetical protein
MPTAPASVKYSSTTSGTPARNSRSGSSTAAPCSRTLASRAFTVWSCASRALRSWRDGCSRCVDARPTSADRPAALPLPRAHAGPFRPTASRASGGSGAKSSHTGADNGIRHLPLGRYPVIRSRSRSEPAIRVSYGLRRMQERRFSGLI